MNLFLDDIRDPKNHMSYMHPDIQVIYNKKDWKVVRNYYEFIEFIENNQFPDLISFDHDLDVEHYDIFNRTDSLSKYYKIEDREMTGYDCIKWLIEYCINNDIKFPEYIIHSQNAVGSQNMKTLIENYKSYEEKR